MRDEGLRLKVYKDSEGIETIGVGRNLQKGITREEAMFLLDNDIKAAIQDAMTFDWYNDLDEVRQRVIINMIFNLGLYKFGKFKKTIAAIKNQDWNTAADEMLNSHWARQVGIRARRLAKMMRTGQ